MKSECQKLLLPLSLFLLFIFTLSCSGRSGKKEPVVVPAVIQGGESHTNLIRVISPDENTGFKLHQTVKVSMALEDNKQVPDSVNVYFNGNYVASVKADPWNVNIPASLTVTTGRKSLKVTAYKGGKAQNTVTRFMIVYSDIIPVKEGYKVVHAYPHDKDAFTQGLVWDNGKFFEGTGQETGSSLREVDPETGKVLRQLNLDQSLFGEGIAILDGKIYQVTWKDKIGFVYDKSDFRLINKIYYSTQGWGLTTVDGKIVMSDGTNTIYFFEPEMFTVVSKIEVYDNEKKVDQLNELEYINGEIWANIWMTDTIARIDPVSGKVLAYINLKNLLPRSDRTETTDVLNGIAYDKDAKRIFLTGKYWPKLFEVRITD